MGIFEWLGLERQASEAGPKTAETRTLREIVSALEALEPQRARFVAGFAYLLGRVAQADLDISPPETAEMERIVRQVGGLPEDQAILVVQAAKTHARLFGGTEDFLVAREFGQIASRAEKLSLLRCLFAVSAADDEISAVESSVIAQIADELKIDRDEVAAMRASFSAFLGSLRTD